MKNRKIAQKLKESYQSKTGRILILTGARQTGKTTLARHLYPGYEYLSIEDPVMRTEYSTLTASQWKSLYPQAILDEVQKEPRLIESVKSVYDQWPEPRYILLGSSQLLLLQKVKESLAGRCVIFEIYPLTLPELRTGNWDEPVNESLFQQILTGTENDVFLPSFRLDKQMVNKEKAWDHLLTFGAYPAVSDELITPREKYEWLDNYVKTYLERDIRDLATFRDLEPFVKCQRYMAQNTGRLLNASGVAGQLGLSVKTVQRYIRYFELSYQSVILPGWSKNPNKRLTRMEKFHFLDHGILQTILRKKGGITGEEFESIVVSEIVKQISTVSMNIPLYHLRTYDGKEVDLILEFPDSYLAFEIKKSEKITPREAKNLIGLEHILDKPLKHAYILSNDHKTHQIQKNITAVNVNMFLG